MANRKYNFKTILNAHENIKPKHFDTHNITHTKAGKVINNYDFIQENNIDTEIYPTLQKYGTIQPMVVNKQAILDELGQMDFMTLNNKIIQADQMWKNLPLELRQQFNNDKLQFVENGKKWLEDQIKEEQKPIEQPEPIKEEDEK